MKKFTTTSGLVSVIVIIIGVVLKLQHIGGAALCIVFGFGWLSFFFVPIFGHRLINEFTGNKSKFASFCGSLLFVLIALGAAFGIQHWPGAGLFVIFQFSVLSFFLLPSLMIVKIKSAKIGRAHV